MNRLLDPAQGIKPLDFGGNGITGSVDVMGRLIALNQYHSIGGYVSLSVMPHFTEADRYDQQAVRRYRASLAQLEGFGPYFSEEIIDQEAFLLADVIPHIELKFSNGGVVHMTLLVTEHGILQSWEFSGIQPDYWGGHLSLQRCAYTQLTEGGPLQYTPSRTTLIFDENQLFLDNKMLGWANLITGLPLSNQSSSQTLASADLMEFRTEGTAQKHVILAMTGAETQQAVQAKMQALKDYDAPAKFAQLRDQQIVHWQKEWETVPDDIILRRGLVYGQMMAVPVNDEASCILTDHMLLPLSWNRDAYFVAHMFLQAEAKYHSLVRQHLLWMFEVAERNNDEWGRCYLASGRQKDPAYQLDQQLFPLLELVEYVEKTGDTELFKRLQPQVEAVIAQILKRKAEFAWLFPTDETPADDPVAFPYHFSSHVLAWYTFHKIHTLAPNAGYAKIAKAIFQDTHHYFVGNNAGTDCFAYATDGQGNYSFYHDANDTPLVLAPLWGFVEIDNSVWQATLHFGFSSKNSQGFYQGHLGSVHTRAPWPLGDIQELLLANLTQDEAKRDNLETHLKHAAQWDGALSEAYDAETYAVVSRHWFAWPNAFYAMLKLEKLI